MSRSLKKNLFIDQDLKDKFTEHSAKFHTEPTKHPLFIQNRGSLILPEHVNFLFKVHNGKKYISVYVTSEMIGHKFGEFALTRKLVDQRKKNKPVRIIKKGGKR